MLPNKLVTKEQELRFQDLLGTGVNILEDLDMFDINDLISKKKNLPIIKLATGTHKVSLPGIAEKVKVSDSVKVISGGVTTKGSDILVKTGSELTNDFTIDAQAHAEYVGISVESGGGYSLTSTIKQSSLYGLTAIRQDHFHADIIIPGNESGRLEILDNEFLQAVDCLKQWKEADEIKEAYLEFFKTWGTHIIVKCYYGSRFALQVKWENAMSKSKENYKANIKAEFGTNFGGKVDVAEDAFYKEYREQRSKASSVTGGNQSTSMILQHDPGNEKAFKAWANTLDNVESGAVTGATVQILGEFLCNCGKRQQGIDLITAMKYFTKDEPVPITVYGHLYTTSLKSCGDLFIEIWHVQSFEIGGMSGAGVEDTKEPQVKKFVSKREYNEGSSGWDGYYFAGWVKINGLTGTNVVIAFYNDHDTRNIHLQLHPPGGPISILFDSNEKYCETTIPSLLASGKYSSS